MTQKFAWMKGAKRVIAVDHDPVRLNHAKRTNNVETFNYKEYDDIGKYLHESTRGGAEVVIDCVGMDGEITAKDRIKTLGGQIGTRIIMRRHFIRETPGTPLSRTPLPERGI